MIFKNFYEFSNCDFRQERTRIFKVIYKCNKTYFLQIRPIRIRLTVQNLRDSVVFKITHFLRNRSLRLGLKLPL